MKQCEFWLRNATVVTMNRDGEIFEQADLLIRNGHIDAIGSFRESQVEAHEVVDLHRHVVIPGFVQCHIHLCQTLLRNFADDMVLIDWLRRRVWPYEAALTPETLYTSARIGLAELILGGTTALLDMGTVHHTDAIGEAVKDAGIRAHIGKCMMDLGDEVPPPMSEATDESMRESLRLYELWDGAADGRIRYAFAPRFAVSCTEELLRQVGEAADDLGCPIHTHSSETEFENEFTRQRYGKTNVAFLDDVGITGDRSVFAHGVHLHDRDTEILADTHTAICHCPSSNLKLASGIANIPQLDQKGVPLAVGADGAPCNNNLDAFIEMRLAALIHKPHHGPEAMPAERVLRLATIDGARALGIDDEVGSIEEGKSADLVVLSLDDDPGCGPAGDVVSRIVYTAQKHNVRQVFASGRRLVDDGELVGVDVPRLMARGRQAHCDVLDDMQQFIS